MLWFGNSTIIKIFEAISQHDLRKTVYHECTVSRRCLLSCPRPIREQLAHEERFPWLFWGETKYVVQSEASILRVWNFWGIFIHKFIGGMGPQVWLITRRRRRIVCEIPILWLETCKIKQIFEILSIIIFCLKQFTSVYESLIVNFI